MTDWNTNRVLFYNLHTGALRSSFTIDHNKVHLNQPSTPHSPAHSPTSKQSLRGLCVDNLDNMIVCEFAANRISAFDLSGNYLMQVGEKGAAEGQFKGPYDVHVDQSGDMIVADFFNHRVHYFA